MNGDGSCDQELVAAPDDVGQAIDEFEWAPNGCHIAYISTNFVGGERGMSNLRVVNVCTGEDILIAEDVTPYGLTWQPLPYISSLRVFGSIKRYQGLEIT